MSTDTLVSEVTLNWTDLTGKKTGATKLGSNKFYRAQVFDQGGTFRVLFTYGRVGQAGQTQEASAKTLPAAQAIVDKKLKEKEAKGYTRVDLRTDAEEATKAAAHGTAAGAGAAAPAKPKAVVARTREFHPEVENLLKLFYQSTSKAVAAGLSSSAGASADAPLGNLSDKQLDKGADILEKIEDLLKKSPSKNDLLDLTNDYFSTIPRNIDHARKGARLDLSLILINSDDRIKEQRKFITLLRDAFLQKEVFAKAAEVEDPMEVWYDGLKCDIAWVDPKGDEYKRLKGIFDKGQSPHNSNFHGRLKLQRAWTLTQQGRKAPFDAYAEAVTKKKNATGVTYGWHGTRTENLMGICKGGLVLPKNLPKGVHITGRAFGLGIYHTPCWADSGESTKDENGKSFTRHNGALKSMNYTSIRGAMYGDGNTSDKGYLILEELALGVAELALEACFDKANPDPGCDYIYGRAWKHKNGRLVNDEVVTFDENASRRTAVLEIAYK